MLPWGLPYLGWRPCGPSSSHKLQRGAVSYKDQSLLLWDISICRTTRGAAMLEGKQGLVWEQSPNFACKRWRLLLMDAARSDRALAVGCSANLGEQDLRQDGGSWQPRLELG